MQGKFWFSTKVSPVTFTVWRHLQEMEQPNPTKMFLLLWNGGSISIKQCLLLFLPRGTKSLHFGLRPPITITSLGRKLPPKLGSVAVVTHSASASAHSFSAIDIMMPFTSQARFAWDGFRLSLLLNDTSHRNIRHHRYSELNLEFENIIGTFPTW